VGWDWLKKQQWTHERSAHVIGTNGNARRLSDELGFLTAQVIAMDVVNPDDISVGFEDIGGMFDVKQALVRTASSSRSWERQQGNRRERISCLV
jgi:hypothetical protein